MSSIKLKYFAYRSYFSTVSINVLVFSFPQLILICSLLIPSKFVICFLFNNYDINISNMSPYSHVVQFIHLNLMVHCIKYISYTFKYITLFIVKILNNVSYKFHNCTLSIFVVFQESQLECITKGVYLYEVELLSFYTTF